MKEFEEVNCEIRRIVNLPLSVSNKLRNLETEEQNQSMISQEHDVNDYYGGFLYNATYAWLSCDCHFVVFNVKTGESISSWTFRGTVTSVSQFPVQPGDLPLLLIGLDNNASKPKESSGLLCIFDCTASRVLRAIRMPCGVEKVCVISGGAEWEEFNEKRPDNVLNEMDGVACAVLRDLQHIMIDLRRSTWNVYDLSTVMDETSPAEIDLSVKQVNARRFSQERHAAYNLLNSRIEKYINFNREEFESSPLFGESLTKAIISSTKISCLISGCLDRVIIWQNDGSVGWISAPLDDNMTITHLALLEPTDDPRPFYYLWAVFQDESSSRASPVLRMYAMLFERKYCDRGINLYFNLEADPSLKFEFELNENDRVIGLCTVERETNPEQTDSGVKRGEDNLLLISTSERTLLFDLNQWYKEQMPRTIDERQNPNSILATYRAREHFSQQKYGQVVSFAYVPLSLREFPSNGPNSPEELFYPNSLSLDWVELYPTKLTFWMTRGIQADLLREMAMAGPVILLQPSETFHRCLSVGLVPFNSEFSLASDCNAQREMLLSLCLEQRWSTFLVKCALQWVDGSASYLYPTFLKWGVQRASTIKMLADRLCVPLFDQSGSSIGEADVKTLRFCSQQLECLSNVVAKLPPGTADLTYQRRTLKRVSTYFQVLLWFYDVGLLPETQDLEEENNLPISLALKVPYPYEKLSTSYKEKRAQAIRTSKESSDKEEGMLFIDELIMRECSVLKGQWEREGGVGALGGSYPPPSLQSLLRSYLTDCRHTELHEINCKHQITIYLLMDLAMLLQGLYPSVDQLIKYPSAFKMSPSLIKLTQAFWLLDHEDYQGFLDMMTGQLVSDSDVKDWHHRFILRTLVRNNQHKLALVYLRVRKPPLSSMEEQSVAVSLSVEHGLVQSAFHRRPPCHYEQLLTCFFRACKTYGKLVEILHLALDSEEEEVFIKFLEENKTEDVRLLYYLQRCRYTEAISSGGGYLAVMHHQPSFIEDASPMSIFSMLNAYNTTLPDITKRFSANAAAINLDVDLGARYPRPMSHYKSHDRLRGIHETMIAKARETYLRGDKCQIPFVSAPCMSLKLNNYDANVNCVLFPVRKVHSGKRKVDQIYENDEDANSKPDNVKRRKLSDGSVSSNKSVEGANETELSFATPLVKRKFNASTNKDVVSETPQSILKIRHLIRSSVSPGVAASLQEKQITDNLIDNQSKKTNRQIRFSINQPKKTLTYDDEDEEQQKEEVEEVEKVENVENPEESDKNNVLEEENDASLGSSVNNTSNIASCDPSGILSGNSSISNKSYYFPRPRPSLRRSALQSSIGMSQESSLSKAGEMASDTLSINMHAKTSLGADEVGKSPALTADTSRRRSSLLPSGYMTTILSPSSDIEISNYLLRRESLPVEHLIPQSPSVRRDYKSKFISSTPLTKSIVSQKRVNDERIAREEEERDKERQEKEEEIEEKEDVELKSFVKNTHDTEEPSELERFSDIERSAYGRSELIAEQPSSVEKNVQDDQNESKYNNGNIARRETLDADEEQPVLSNLEEIAGPSLTVLDESEEELLRLRDDDEDEDDDDEVFKSLSPTLEDARIPLESEVPISCLPGIWNLEEHIVDKKSNGLRESVQVTDNVDFTDDDSTTSKDAMILHEPDDGNEKKIYSTVTVDSENILYDITDDESDSNVKETDESKTKKGKLSDLQRPYSTEQSVAEEDKKSETDEENRKSGRRDSILGADTSETSTILDVESQEKETTSLSKRKRTLLEAQDDGQSVRMTRSRRGSSLAKDAVANTSSSQVPETDRVTRSRRASSIAKDSVCTTDSPLQDAEKPSYRTRRASSIAKDPVCTTDSPLQDAEKPSYRTRRASSMAKDLPTDSPMRSAGEPSRLRRASSITLDQLADSPSQITDSPKSSRLRRTNSVKDVPASVKPRSRRASSLMKEVLTSSMVIDEDLRPAVSSESIASVDTPVKRGRSRSTSVAKEIPPSKDLKDSDSESVKNELPVRRSARLTSSTKKESQTSLSKTRAKSESLSSLSKLTSDDEEDRSTRKRSVRTKKPSAKATSRSPTTDLKEQPEVMKASRSRRGSSVPKETTVQTGRKYRSSSIIKEIIPEDAELSLEPSNPSKPRKLRSSAVRTTKNITEEEANDEVARNITPTRRRRAASTTEVEDIRKNEGARRHQGRTQRTSVNEESSNLFSFSQPEKMDDVPLDEKNIGEVPNYVFSPPQTRSKNITSQHRRKIKSFIPSPCQEEEEHSAIQEPNIIVQSGSYTRVIVTTYGSRHREKFVLNRRKSAKE